MSEKDLTIKLNKLSLWKLLTGVFALLFVISLFTSGFGIGDGEDDDGETDTIPTIPTQPTIPTGIVDVSADDDPVKGEEDAPVTIIEFSDFECPFCARFYTQTLSQLEENYINTGKVKLIFRDFPLGFHAMAQPAAEASECADDQGKFWEMHDMIYENQQLLSESSLKQWALDLDLDTNEFNDCLDSGKHAQEVLNDFNDGQSYGVSGTPTFFINGKKLVGAQPYSAFQAIIDAELS